MVLLRKVIGDALRARRLAQHRTLREVSTAANVSLGYLSEIERGHKEASSELLASICDALGAPAVRDAQRRQRHVRAGRADGRRVQASAATGARAGQRRRAAARSPTSATDGDVTVERAQRRTAADDPDRRRRTAGPRRVTLQVTRGPLRTTLITDAGPAGAVSEFAAADSRAAGGWRDGLARGCQDWRAAGLPRRSGGRREDATMANPFVKGWKYLMALFGSKIDEYADPKVQIQQAIEDAQRQHQALVQQAAAVIGNQRQLEMKLSRQLTEVENLQTNARQALVLADRARTGGDDDEGRPSTSTTAQTFATQLVAAEALDGGPQVAARPGARRGAAGPQGGREQRHAAAAEARRADQAAQPARAGQDAGDGGHGRWSR